MYLVIGLVIVATVSLLAALTIGSVETHFSDLIIIASADKATLSQSIILQLRVPRVLSAFATGGLLAMTGVMMQVLLRNPLADPYILGISGGAAVATLLAMLSGISGILLTTSGFMGALLSMFLVFGLAHGLGSWTSTRLLLTGVVIAAGWGAIISFILAVTPSQNLHSMLFWLMGDMSYANSPLIGLSMMAIALILGLILARPLNVFTHGQYQAQSLGIDVSMFRVQVYLITSLMTATAVSIAGTIGFVGLIVPHLVRMLGATDHRILLPSAALFGGTLLVWADTLARTLIAPHQLPVGVVTALLGVPLFLYIMYRGGPQK